MSEHFDDPGPAKCKCGWPLNGCDSECGWDYAPSVEQGCARVRIMESDKTRDRLRLAFSLDTNPQPKEATG